MTPSWILRWRRADSRWHRPDDWPCDSIDSGRLMGALVDFVCADEPLWGTNFNAIDGFAATVTTTPGSRMKIGPGWLLDQHLTSQPAFREASA